MTKKTTTKNAIESLPPEARVAFQLAFQGMGGVKALTTWGRTHRTLYYQMYAKLIPLILQADVETTVKFDAEEARAALSAALMRVIEIRKTAEAPPGTAAGNLVTDATYTRRDAEPEPAVTPSQPPAPAPQSANNIVPLHKPPVATEPPSVAPISTEPTTTQKFLDRNGSDSGRIHPSEWDNK